MYKTRLTRTFQVISSTKIWHGTHGTRAAPNRTHFDPPKQILARCQAKLLGCDQCHRLYVKIEHILRRFYFSEQQKVISGFHNSGSDFKASFFLARQSHDIRYFSSEGVEKIEKRKKRKMESTQKYVLWPIINSKKVLVVQFSLATSQNLFGKMDRISKI